MKVFKKFKIGAIFILLISLFAGFTNSNVMAVDEKVIEEMLIDAKLGQMMCLDIRIWNGKPVTEINGEIKDIISKYHIGNIILFSQNFQSKSQAKKLVEDIQQIAKENRMPPIMICVDQEGGLVERFSFDRSKLRNNIEIGRESNPENAAYNKGMIIGKELRELGIQCDFAPVVDVNSNPKNPVIGVRSFGKTEEVVSKCGVKFMEALHTNNVIATAKHFPGHGDTSTDSHVELPMVTKNFSQLEAMELKPFQRMIDSGVDIIMTAHIQLPNIERKMMVSRKTGKEIYLPATLSKTILTDLLRRKMKFQGVIITDAMNMKAISDNFGEIESIKMAINAGANIICMPTILRNKDDISKLDNIYYSLKNALELKELSIDQVNNSVQRVLDLKAKFIK